MKDEPLGETTGKMQTNSAREDERRRTKERTLTHKHEHIPMVFIVFITRW